MGSVWGGDMKATHQVVILGVLLAALGFQSCRLRQEQRRVGEALLRVDSVEAAADTTRRLNVKALQLLGDSLQGVERRVVQERQRADALDRALGRERIAKANILATVDSLQLVTQSVTDTTVLGTRSVTFQIDTMPYAGTANVTLPPTAPASLDLRLTLAPIPLHLRLGCGDPMNGIRPATATLFGPSWATLRLDSLSQDTALCRSPALQRPVSRSKWLGVGALLGALVVSVLR